MPSPLGRAVPDRVLPEPIYLLYLCCLSCHLFRFVLQTRYRHLDLPTPEIVKFTLPSITYLNELPILDLRPYSMHFICHLTPYLDEFPTFDFHPRSMHSICILTYVLRHPFLVEFVTFSQ